MPNHMEPKRTLHLPESLCAALERHYLSEKYPDLESLLLYILETLTDDTARQLDENEAQIIEKRLRDLGYG